MQIPVVFSALLLLYISQGKVPLAPRHYQEPHLRPVLGAHSCASCICAWRPVEWVDWILIWNRFFDMAFWHLKRVLFLDFCSTGALYPSRQSPSSAKALSRITPSPCAWCSLLRQLHLCLAPCRVGWLNPNLESVFQHCQFDIWNVCHFLILPSCLVKLQNYLALTVLSPRVLLNRRVVAF